MREEFKHDVAKDLAAASGLPAANFRIQDVSPGSIILDMQGVSICTFVLVKQVYW